MGARSVGTRSLDARASMLTNERGEQSGGLWTHRLLLLDMLIDTPRVRHVAQHDLAYLQSRLSKTNL